jgi:hypothetical protein
MDTHTFRCSYLRLLSVISGFENAYITWISNNQPAWTLNVAGMVADTAVQISARPITQEPMVCHVSYMSCGILTERM